MPAIVKDLRPEFDEGPVLVTVEYRVDRDRTEEFLEAIHEYGRVRRRDGAYGGSCAETSKRRIDTSKRSSSGHGQNTSVSMSARRRRIARSRSGCEPTSPACPRCGTSCRPTQIDRDNARNFERFHHAANRQSCG